MARSDTPASKSVEKCLTFIIEKIKSKFQLRSSQKEKIKIGFESIILALLIQALRTEIIKKKSKNLFKQEIMSLAIWEKVLAQKFRLILPKNYF